MLLVLLFIKNCPYLYFALSFGINSERLGLFSTMFSLWCSPLRHPCYFLFSFGCSTSVSSVFHWHVLLKALRSLVLSVLHRLAASCFLWPGLITHTLRCWYSVFQQESYSGKWAIGCLQEEVTAQDFRLASETSVKGIECFTVLYFPILSRLSKFYSGSWNKFNKGRRRHVYCTHWTAFFWTLFYKPFPK